MDEHRVLVRVAASHRHSTGLHHHVEAVRVQGDRATVTGAAFPIGEDLPKPAAEQVRGGDRERVGGHRHSGECHRAVAPEGLPCLGRRGVVAAGPVAEVLTPAVLEPVYRISVRTIVDDDCVQLVFRP